MKKIYSIKEGDRYGKLTLQYQIPSSGRKRVSCVCDCGKNWEGRFGDLTSGNTKSCGCIKGIRHKHIVPLNQKFGMFTIMREVEPDLRPSGVKYRRFLCRCKCGVEKEVNLQNLMKSKNPTQSCGCSRWNIAPTNIGVGIKYNKLTIIKEVVKESPSRRRVLALCDCGKTWEGLFESLLGGKTSSCGCNKKVSPIKERGRYGNLTIRSQIPSSNGKRRVSCVCDCGKTWEGLFESLLGGKTSSCGCTHESRPEQEVRDFVTETLPQEVGILKNDKEVLEGLHLDILIPSHHLAIEFNGLRWHSEFVDLGAGNLKPGKHQNYHLNKTQKCAAQGIFLLHIWEDEWRERKDQIKNKIRNLLQLSPKGVFARKTSVVGVSGSDKQAFYEVNHIQGGCTSTRDLGLVDGEGTLVAVMSLKRRSGVGVWELVRFATSKNVVGGFSKLLKAFQKHNDWNEIISFADRSWSKGDLYEKTGWVLDGILPPDYKYVFRGSRKHKFGYRHAGGGMKRKLRHYCALMTEKENTSFNGIYRIYDCGKLRYKIKNPSNVQRRQ